MDITDAVRSLDRELHDIFGARLESVVVYKAHAASAHTPTMAVVRNLSASDLRACASKVASWHERGLATPLVMGADEFACSLDAFPFEFGAILAAHAVVSGTSPFKGLHVDPADFRRACEIQARGLLLHLREGFMETEGRSDRVADLLQRSATALAPLLGNAAQLLGENPGDAPAAAAAVERRLGLLNTGLVEIVSSSEAQPLSSEDARRIFPTYLTALERLASLVDTWGASS